jgi:hypothetical protein
LPKRETSFDVSQLLFFPTPYPDEILYSVLCRYHSRCGSPSPLQTNCELWGKKYGKRLFLPDGIARFASMIPAAADLTADRFITENTIFPWLKPFISQERGEKLLNTMKHGDPDIYSTIGFFKVLPQQPRYLRYCRECAETDMSTYGETYWHRVHQLPGVYVCPVHGTLTLQSDIELNELHREYAGMPPYCDDITPADKWLTDVAADALWLLRHGCAFGYSEDTYAMYDRWLRVKGFRFESGMTNRSKLANALIDCYGSEQLNSLDAYNSGALTWLQHLTQDAKRFHNPVHHALLMRFLAGSAKLFFAGTDEDVPVYLPYGLPPYPCRNVVCGCYLQDVIPSIEIRDVKGNLRATFVCPHCGFAYRRKKPLPKDEQYSGQIDVFDYGWLWHEKLKTMLDVRTPVRRIGMALQCDTRTVMRLGIELGYFPPERQPKLRPYIAHPKPETTFEQRRDYYRERWLTMMKGCPAATRNELRLIDSKAEQWLHLNDADWYEENSPASLRRVPVGMLKDEKYAERIENAMKQIRGSPEKPKRLSVAALGKVAGIPKIHRFLNSGDTPKLTAALKSCSETPEQWQHRKIVWAIGQMRQRGEVVTVYKVRYRAAIQDPERKLDAFITQCIMESE